MQDVKKIDEWNAAIPDETIESVENAARRSVKKIKRLVDQLGWTFEMVAQDANKFTETNEWTAEIVETAYRAAKRKKRGKTKSTAKKDEDGSDKSTDDTSAAATQESGAAAANQKPDKAPRKYTEAEVDLSKGKSGIVYLRKEQTPPQIGETIIMPSGAVFVVRKVAEDKPHFGEVRGYELSVERVSQEGVS